jgi:hypothetical protein
MAAMSSRVRAKVEDIDVLGDAFRPKGLGDRAEPVLDVPAKHDLSRSRAVLRSQLHDDRMREWALSERAIPLRANPSPTCCSLR